MEIVIIFVNHSVWFLTVFKDIICSAVHSLEVSGDLKSFSTVSLSQRSIKFLIRVVST